MSGGRKQAQPAGGRPLDEVVRRLSHSSFNVRRIGNAMAHGYQPSVRFTIPLLTRQLTFAAAQREISVIVVLV